MSAFGATEAATAILVLAAILSLWTDLLRGKIYNWITFPLFGLGLLWQLWMHGMEGVFSGILGAALGLALFGVMYHFKAMGAGT